MRIKVMRTIFKPDVPGKFVLYPYHIFHLKLFYRRLGRSDRVFDYFAYVDLYRLGAERGDGFIDLYEWDVDERQVMKPLADYEEARRKAFESAIIWGNSRVVSWWLPRIEVVRDAQAYKVFWIFEEEGEKYVMDSLTGEKFGLGELAGKDGRKCRGLWCR
ncbi:type I 3-dehydroquinate dehydratase [Thermococcus atlanticus]